MKRLYTLIAIFFAALSAYQLKAQDVVDVITNVNQPTAIFIDGDDMYYGDFVGGLSKVQLSDPVNPIVVYPSTGVYRTALNGNDLFITAINDGLIVKIDITESEPTAIEVASNIALPSGIAILDDILYFSSQGGLGIVGKLDLTETNPQATIVQSGFSNPTGIAIIGTDLYVAEFFGNRVSKIDLNDSNPTIVEVATGLENPTALLANGNQLFVSEIGGNKVSTIDLGTEPALVEDLVTGLTEPTGLFLEGTDLYISVFGENKIVKYAMPSVGLDYLNSSSDQLSVFPNPSSDFIQISDLDQKENYRIYSLLGLEVGSGNISPQENIDIQYLDSGIYMLIFDDGSTMNFMKE
ncbi:MAG: T9SS type A sorting domain-containing protein [Flavobacteriales bacterium]|nr:T9SS type A sorting domain-containing protein [Flavobacteriales bacterium]